jgi:hypothetical protein
MRERTLREYYAAHVPPVNPGVMIERLLAIKAEHPGVPDWNEVYLRAAAVLEVRWRWFYAEEMLRTFGREDD